MLLQAISWFLILFILPVLTFWQLLSNRLEAVAVVSTWKAASQASTIVLSLCWILTIGPIPAYAQLGQPPATMSLAPYQALPPSPTVASLGVYGNIPVGYHTGIPGISVPLHSLDLKGLSIPIALTYHSTGLLVDERAGNVGLGWSCTALNVVGHTIMGGIDDFEGGFCQGSVIEPIPYAPFPIPPWDGVRQSWSDDVLLRRIDTEPDVYNYSLPGRSGKFVFDRNAVAHPIPYESLKIQRVGASGVADGIVITDESGNVYTFGYAPRNGASVSEGSVVTQLTQGCGSPGTTKDFSGTTGYFLTQIVTPYRDTVEFHYRLCQEKYNNPLDLTEYEARLNQGGYYCNNIFPRHDCVTRTTHITQVLTQITHRGESVEFAYDSARLDLAGGLMLKRITVKSDGIVRKQFDLFHSYFGTPSMASGSTTPGLTAEDCLRLRLDSVRQRGMPAFRFTYNGPGQYFPAVRSYGQDLWGYYNGLDANPTLVGRPSNMGGNRMSDSLAMKIGMLRQITYPTGGTSTFHYEANTIHRQSFSTGIGVLAQVGAFADSLMPSDVQRAYFVLTAPLSVTVTASFPAGGATISGGNGSVALTDSTGRQLYSVVSAVPQPVPVVLALGPGTYRISARAQAGRDFNNNTVVAMSGISVSGEIIIPAGPDPVGGCRIKLISHDGRTPYGDAGTTRYLYNDSLGRSSGYVLNRPILTSQTQINQVQNGNDVACSYNVHMQSSANQVGLINGSVAAYTRVTTLTKAGGNMPARKSVYSYNVVHDDDQFSNTYPFPPPSSYDWLRGKLIKEQDYRFSTETNAYALAREKWYTYQANFSLLASSSAAPLPFPNEAIITGYRISTIASGTSTTNPGNQNFNVVLRYHHYSASVYLTQTRETLFDAQGHTFANTQLFKYDDHNLLVNQAKSANSHGDTLVQATFYGVEGVSGNSFATTANSHLRALRWQRDHHIINQPTEKTRYRIGQPTFPLQRSLTLLSLSHGMALPKREYASQGGLSVTVPVSYPDASRDSLVFDASYVNQVNHSAYDNRGNVVQQSLSGGASTAYVSGYDGDLLIAQAVNSAWQQVAFTSFEPAATGRWQYDSLNAGRFVPALFTGTRGYQLDGTPAAAVRRPGLPAGDYDLTVWGHGLTAPQVTGGTSQHYERGAVAGTSGWRQHRFRFWVPANGTVTLNCGANQLLWIDELRLCPVGAQMTTYTHAPLVGVTSQADPSGRTARYEYDALGRLLRVRDEQGRILSQQQYHYARP